MERAHPDRAGRVSQLAQRGIGSLLQLVGGSAVEGEGADGGGVGTLGHPPGQSRHDRGGLARAGRRHAQHRARRGGSGCTLVVGQPAESSGDWVVVMVRHAHMVAVATSSRVGRVLERARPRITIVCMGRPGRSLALWLSSQARTVRTDRCRATSLGPSACGKDGDTLTLLHNNDGESSLATLGYGVSEEVTLEVGGAPAFKQRDRARDRRRPCTGQQRAHRLCRRLLPGLGPAGLQRARGPGSDSPGLRRHRPGPDALRRPHLRQS